MVNKNLDSLQFRFDLFSESHPSTGQVDRNGKQVKQMTFIDLTLELLHFFPLSLDSWSMALNKFPSSSGVCPILLVHCNRMDLIYSLLFCVCCSEANQQQQCRAVQSSLI